MRVNSLPGELIAVIARSDQAFTQRELTPERMSSRRQLAEVVGRSDLAFGRNRQDATNELPEPSSEVSGVEVSGQARSAWAAMLFALSLILLIVELIPTKAPGALLAVAAGFRNQHPGLFAIMSFIAIVTLSTVRAYHFRRRGSFDSSRFSDLICSDCARKLFPTVSSRAPVLYSWLATGARGSPS